VFTCNVMLSALLLAVLPLALTINFDTNVLDSDELTACLTSNPNCQFNDRPWSFVNNTGVPSDFENTRVWTRLFDYSDAALFESCTDYGIQDYNGINLDTCLLCQPDWVYLFRLQKFVRSAEGKVEDVFFLDKAFVPTDDAWETYCLNAYTVPPLDDSDLVSDKTRSFYRYFASSTCYSNQYCAQASSVAPLESKSVCKPHTVLNFPSGQFCKYMNGYDNIYLTVEMGCAGTDTCESVRFRQYDDDDDLRRKKRKTAKTHVSKRGINLDELLCVYAENDFAWTWS